MDEKDVTSNTEDLAVEEEIEDEIVMAEAEDDDALDDEGTDGDDGDDDDSDDGDAGNQETPAEKALREENEALKEKNKNLYEKLKSGYKKNAKTKETVKTEYVSKEDARKIFEEVQKDKEDEQKLVEKYEDAKEIMSEVQKTKREKNLSTDEAYALVKGKMLSDEGYRNQVIADRTANHGSFQKKEEGFKYKHLFTTPKVSIPKK